MLVLNLTKFNKSLSLILGKSFFGRHFLQADRDLLQGFIRWRQNRRALKKRSHKVSDRIDEAVESSYEESSQSKLHKDLSKADRRTAHHISVPAKKERLIMGKLKLVGLILLFLLAGALFFVAGFLTCYTVFPPSQTSYSSHLPEAGPYGASRPSEGLGAAPSSSHVTTPANTYASRHSLLQSARGEKGSILRKAEDQTAYQAKLQAHNLITRTLNRWSMKLRSALGFYAGSAIAPITTGLAKQVVDKAIPLNRPGTAGSHASSSQSTTSSPMGHTGSGGSAVHPGATTSAAIPSSSSTPGLYTIMVQSFSNNAEAFHLAGELHSHGFGAYVAQEQSGSGIHFSVKVGQFSNFTDARNAAAILSQQWHRPARVVMIDSAGGH